MTPQSYFMLVAPIAPGKEAALRSLLETMNSRHGVADPQNALVPFGKFVCTGKLPKCSTCPVLEFCRQVGVTSHR